MRATRVHESGLVDAPARAPRPSLRAGVGGPPDRERAEGLGHRFDAGPAVDAPIQRLRTSAELFHAVDPHNTANNLHIAKMRAALKRYHAAAQPRWYQGQAAHQSFADQRAEALHEAQHHAQQYLTKNRDVRAGGPTTTEDGRRATRKHVMNTLDELQEAHQQYVDDIHNRNLRLWVPGRDQMNEAQRTQLDADWDKLRGFGPGSPLTADDPRTQRQVRALSARLMTGQRGRELMHAVLDGTSGKTMQINHVDADTADLPARRLRRQRQDQQSDLERQVREHVAAAHAAEQADNPEQAEHHRGQAGDLEFQRLDMSNPVLQDGRWVSPPPVGDPSAGDAGKVGAGEDRRTQLAGGYGDGSSSEIGLREGVKDSEFMVRQHGDHNFIPTPAFVLFGHELIHALHNRTGSNAKALDPGNAYRPTDEQAQRGELPALHEWSNREEHETIDGGNPLHPHLSENALREEHGLGRRFGHAGARSFEEIDERRL